MHNVESNYLNKRSIHIRKCLGTGGNNIDRYARVDFKLAAKGGDRELMVVSDWWGGGRQGEGGDVGWREPW